MRSPIQPSAPLRSLLAYLSATVTALLISDNTTVLQTAPGWRCSNGTEYLPSPVAWSSIPDVLDARAPVQGWTAPGYDDSAWGVAAPVDGSTWGPLFARAMPLAVEAPLPLASLAVMPAGTPLAASLPLTLSTGQSVVIDLGRMAMVYADLELTAPAAGAVLNLDYALRFVDGTPRETYGAGSTLTTRAGPQRLFGGDQWCSHYMIISVQVRASTVLGVCALAVAQHTRTPTHAADWQCHDHQCDDGLADVPLCAAGIVRVERRAALGYLGEGCEHSGRRHG